MLDSPSVVSRPFPITPLIVMWIVFIIGCLTLLNRQYSFVFDRIFFSLLGLTGIVILLLWLFSDHESTNQNMNLLWALPTHLYFIFRMGRNAITNTVKYYFLGVMVLSVLLIALWLFIPQGFNAAFFPLVLLTGVKAGRVMSYGLRVMGYELWVSWLRVAGCGLFWASPVFFKVLYKHMDHRTKFVIWINQRI